MSTHDQVTVQTAFQMPKPKKKEKKESLRVLREQNQFIKYMKDFEQRSDQLKSSDQLYRGERCSSVIIDRNDDELE